MGGRGRLKPPFFYSPEYLNTKIVPTTYKKIPKKTWSFVLSILCAELAPTLAINMVIGINIKKAGTLIKPMLKGNLTFKTEPEYQKPIAPQRAIIKPIAAALPMALLIG